VRIKAAVTGLFVALALGAALRWTSPERAADLRPRPDALEYEEAALRLASGDGYVLRIGNLDLPPRYPPGFSALLAPVVGAFPDRPGIGVVVVLASALVAIAAAWQLGFHAGGRASAVAAALLLAVSPAHVRWSKAVLSDVPGSAAVAWLAVWTIALLRGPAGVRAWLALGAVSGLAAAVRPSALDLAPVTALLLLADPRLAARARVARVVAVAVGIALGLAPSLALNSVRFGSPFASGYGYWAPDAYFGTSYLFGAVNGGETANVPFYAAQLAGLGRLYSLPVAIMIAGGAWILARAGGDGRRLLLLALGSVTVMLARQLPFFWQSERYALSVVPLVCAVASAPFGSHASRRVRAAGAVLALLAALAAVRGWRDLAPPDNELFDARALAAIDRVAEPNAAVVARTSPLLFQRILRSHGSDRVWVPLGIDEHRFKMRRLGRAPLAMRPAEEAAWLRDSIEPPVTRPRVAGVVERLLAEGRPVYFSTQLLGEVENFRWVRPILEERYLLEPVARFGTVEVFRLRKRFAVQ